MAVFRHFQHILKVAFLTFVLCISSAFAVVPTLHPNGCFDSVEAACGDDPNTCIATPDANDNPRVFVGWSSSANGGNNFFDDVTSDSNIISDAYAICTTGTFAVRVQARISTGSVFRFSLSAKGNFTVDYGDGTVDTITRTDTTAQEYSHTYSNVGYYLVKFSGVATEYNSSVFSEPRYYMSASYNWNWSRSAISFYTRGHGSAYTDSADVVGVYGSLGSIFPTIGATETYDPTDGLASNSAELLAIQPRFAETFNGTGIYRLPDNLFDGISGQAADNMFTNTFYSSLLNKVPSNLFSGITGAASNLFGATFESTYLRSIPSGLFSGITGAAEYMFHSTFARNVRLTAIPSGLFSGVSGAATGMFGSTFSGCSELTTVPSGLFSGVSGAAQSMFGATFMKCSRLTTIPSGLFSGVTGAADYMFMDTFAGGTNDSNGYNSTDCGLTSIPSDLFSGVTGGASNMFRWTFRGCKDLAQITQVGSTGLFSGVTSAKADIFLETFYNCQSLTTIPSNTFATSIDEIGSYSFAGMFQKSGLTSIPSGLFDGINDNSYNDSYAFQNTFAECTNLTSIPENLFKGVKRAAGYQFYRTFYGCTSLTSLPRSLFPNLNDYTSYYTFKEMFAGDTNLSGYVHANFFGSLSASGYTSSDSAMDDIFMGTNLDTVCPAGNYETISTNFSVDWAINGNGDKAVMCRPDQYSINVYGITYTNGYNNATISPDIPDTYDSDTPTFTIGTPTRTGYTFGGWCMYDSSSNNTTSCAEPQQTITFTKGVTTGNKWLYAKWTANQYNIHYDLDGGMNPTDQYNTFTYLEQSTLTLKRPAKIDYGFVGWCVYDSATNDGANCANPTDRVPRYYTSDLWVYAVWEPITYPFTMTTTTETSDFTFGIKINARGTFYIDWGDGTAEEKKMADYTSSWTATHNYTVTDTTNGQHFTIRLGGAARNFGSSYPAYPQNGYNNQYGSYTVLKFLYPTKLAGISGSLGAIFPTDGGAAATRNKTDSGLAKIQPSFSTLFADCTNLTSPIPATLFDGVVGQPLPYMFNETFSNTKLTGSIPSTLFSGINGEPTNYLFANTFSSCSNLTGAIPSTLFSGISGDPAQNMFDRTFDGCSGLGRDAIEDNPNTTDIVENAPKYSIPATLFSGIDGEPANWMFSATFRGCSGLTGSIPATLFSGIDGKPETYMFYATFSGCTGLTGEIPATLFSGIDGEPAQYMFSNTFYNCSGLTGPIPAALFSGVKGEPANNMFYATFRGCSGLTGTDIPDPHNVAGAHYAVPSTLFSGIKGAPKYNMFEGTFYGCSSLTGSIPADLFGGIYGDQIDYMFRDTFRDCTNLGKQSIGGTNKYFVPATLFGGINTGTSAYYPFDGVFVNTGLAGCPSNADSYSPMSIGGKSVCILYDDVVCSAANTLSGASCLGCSGDDCPVSPTLYTCPDGYTSNSTHDECVQTYTIHYELSGGTTSRPTSYDWRTNTFSITKSSATRTGYSLTGWCVYDTETNDGVNCETPQTSVTFTKGVTTGDKWLYAIWTPVVYNIYYYLYDGTVASENPTTYTVETPTITLNNPTKAGYDVFDGWCASSSNTCSDPQQTMTIPTGSTGHKQFAAKYSSPTVYNITYDLNGGTLATENPTTYTVETDTFTLNNPTKSNLLFVGWCEDAALTQNCGVNKRITKGSMGNKAFYAKYMEENYPFQMTTTNLDAGDYFDFYIGAKGDFIVDCGEGGVLSGNYVATGTNLINKPSVGSNSYRCTYSTTGGVKTIRLGGLATGYGTSSSDQAITITSNEKLAGISGSLGAIFPTIGVTAQNPDPTAGLDPVNDAATLNAIQPSFYYTFYNCYNLTGTIPQELFDGVVGQPRASMFSHTFYGCPKLTGSIPAKLFGGINGGPAQSMFDYTFYGCTNLGKDSVDGTSTYYIPPTLFSGISKETTATYQMDGVFYNTGLLTTCPYGTSVYTTGFESYFTSKVSCIRANEVICPAGQFLTGSARTCAACSGDDCPATPQLYTCPSSYASSNHTSCDVDFPFVMTTTSLTANDSSNNYFAFQISAAGTFYVDWGDGVIEQITKNNTYNYIYAHAYETDGVKTVRLGGVATGYNTGREAAIKFNELRNNSYITVYGNVANVSVTSDNNKLAGISGSLGAIFPTIGATENYDPTAGLDPVNDADTLNAIQPSFYYTFNSCSKLTGTIPQDLFDGVVGQPRSSMFYYTFSYCHDLTGAIPSTLFGGIKGKPAPYMFSYTFNGCGGLGRDAIEDDPNTPDIVENAPKYSIPATLFSGISGKPAQYMFSGTFYNCSGLTGSIPATLFGGIDGEPAQYMFMATFGGCSNLTGEIPEDLFGRVVNGTYYGINGDPAQNMFDFTFYGCSNLIGEIPEDLFGRVVDGTYYGINGDPAQSMFRSTFGGCSNLTGEIPEDLFGRVVDGTYYGINGAPANFMFESTFNGCSNLTGEIPEKLFGRVVDGTYYGVKGNPANSMFETTFSGCSGLSGEIPANLFGGITDISNPSFYDYYYFRTFYNCTNLGKDSVDGTSSYYIPANLMQRDVLNQSAIQGTGLQTSCPSNMAMYNNAGYAYSCIDRDSIVCPAGTYLNNGVCSECSGNDCLVVRSVVSCAPETNLPDFSGCVQPYTITYENMTGATLSTKNPVQYYYYNSKYYYRTDVNDANWSGTSSSSYWLSNPTRPDATFLGWCDDAALTSNCSTSKYVYFNQNQDITLYAKWRETYNISYELNGGDWGNYGWTNYNPSTYNNIDSAYINYQPQKTGYGFVGWCDDEELTQNCDTYRTIPSGTTGDKKFWAKWVLLQRQCEAGTYAYVSGSDIYCTGCESGYYCTGKNRDGGSALTEVDNGRYECPTHKPNSKWGAKSLEDCTMCPYAQFDYTEEFPINDFQATWYDMNGDGLETINECVDTFYVANDENEFRKCIEQSMYSTEELINMWGKDYYKYGYDKPCDYNKVNLGTMTCQYNPIDKAYTNCSSMFATCSSADLQTWIAAAENSENSMSKDLVDLELAKKELNKTTMDWDDFFVQDFNDIDSADDIVRYNTCEPEGYKYCPETTYYSISAADCVDCPAGSYCVGGLYATDSVADAGIEACSGNTFSGAKATSCTQCPVGVSTANQNHTSCVCTNNDFTYDSEKNICYVDSCDSGNNICCDPGYYVMETESTEATNCWRCYEKGDDCDYCGQSSACWDCYKGEDNACDTCYDYIASLSKSFGCGKCESGYYCPGIVEPIVNATDGDGAIVCEDGYYSTWYESTCRACPAGTTSNNDHTSCVCPAGYEWNSKSFTCEFSECPYTRIVSQASGGSYTKWDVDACYTNTGSLIENATEAECSGSFEWRNNKCFLAGTDKEVPGITTKFGCEYTYDTDHIMVVPMAADLDGNKKTSIDECVLFIENLNNPQAGSQAEMDMRVAACRYNTTTKDYTDCSITLGACSENDLMAMAGNAQTGEEMFIAILNNAKTKVGAATWDAFFGRDFTDANHTALIDNANGMITSEIINQNSFSMCCPVGQYLLNDNGVAACDTCPSSPANTYCPGGTYETSATAGAMQCPSGATVNNDQTGCDCSAGYEWNSERNTCEFTTCPAVSVASAPYYVLANGYMDFGGMYPKMHFLYDFDNNGDNITDCVTMVVKADDLSMIESDPVSANITGTSFCRYDEATQNYTNCATPLKACNENELNSFMFALNEFGTAAAFRKFTELAGKQSPNDLTFGNAINSLTDANNCLTCPEPTKTFDIAEGSFMLLDLNGDNQASQDECVFLGMSATDIAEAGECMSDADCNWEQAGLKLFACRYNTTTGDYDDCSEALNMCNATDMKMITDVPGKPSMSARYLAVLRNVRTKMGLSNTNPDWNNDFFTVDMSSQSTITDDVIGANPHNVCLVCPINTNETITLGNNFVDVGAMESSFVFPYDFANDGESLDDCVKVVAQWDMANSELPTALSVCKYDSTTDTYFGSCATPVATCTKEDLWEITDVDGGTAAMLQAFATKSNVQSPSDLSFNQSGANLDSGVVCPIQCPSDGDPDGVVGGSLIKDSEYVESLSSCAKAYIWTDNDLYKMAVCKYNTDTGKYDICADNVFTACTSAQVSVLSSASTKTSDVVGFIDDTYNTIVGTDVNGVTDIPSLNECPCESGYEWNSSKYACEFTTCPYTRGILKAYKDVPDAYWKDSVCYTSTDLLIENATEAECEGGFEWRNNKCFLTGTDKEVPGITTKFGCEYTYDAGHMMVVPMVADLNGDRTSAIDECVVFMEIIGDPEAETEEEMDLRFGACRYNTTTKDYTDCSITLGACSEQELMAMAEGAKTEEEMFLAILNNTKTKVGAATWDAFFGRDFTNANYTSLIDNANGTITHTILNQDSFSMCCPAGQYLSNDNGVATCDTCPSSPANTYCPGGTYETSATAGAMQCPSGATVNLEQTACDCSALGGRYHWDADTNTCAACPLGSSWNVSKNTCDAVSCPIPQQSYTNPSPINTQGGPGVMEISNKAIRKSYGATENECTVMRIYYETSTPLMNGETIENYVEAGASVAFCRYDSNTGSYDNKCTKKYTFCEDDSMEDFAAAIQTNGSTALMQHVFGIDTEEEIAALFTENSADLESETAVNRCCPEGWVCCGAGTYIDFDAIGTADQCPTCPAGSYCEGKQWDPETTFDSGETQCGTGTYNPKTGAVSADACLSCPTAYPLSAIGTTDIAQCYANCPQTPVCVDNASESACAYVNPNQTTKTFGNVCGTNITSCNGGYTPTGVSTWVSANFNKIRPLAVCYLNSQSNCERTISAQETITLNPGQFAVALNDGPITNARGYVSCNETAGNTSSAAARIDANANFVPTTSGTHCWVKWTQMGDMEVNSSWVYVTAYASDTECASSCGMLMNVNNPYPYQTDVLSALIMNTAQNQLRICEANAVNIVWDGVAEPDNLGVCTYGKDLPTPQTKPEQAGKLFLGWKPVSVTNNSLNP